MKAWYLTLALVVLIGCARGVAHGPPQPEQDVAVWTEFAALLDEAIELHRTFVMLE
jgi:hypothetical protein